MKIVGYELGNAALIGQYAFGESFQLAGCFFYAAVPIDDYAVKLTGTGNLGMGNLDPRRDGVGRFCVAADQAFPLGTKIGTSSLDSSCPNKKSIIEKKKPFKPQAFK